MALATTEELSQKPAIVNASGVKLAKQPARWADFRLRFLSAVILAPMALICIWIGGSAFDMLIAMITIGLSYEWLSLCGQRGSLTAWLLFACLPLAVVTTAFVGANYAIALLGIATLVGLVLGRGLSRKRPLAFGIPYLGLAAVALIWLRQPQLSGGANVIVLLLVVWASDIGAYVVGRTVGGPRLAPTISPGKTWSGAAGGLIAAAVVGFAASVALGGWPGSWRPQAFAVLIGIVSQIGDLFESNLKRQFGVKDSGAVIPGHGGLLDRLDAVLTAAPATALLVLILGPGVVLWE